MPSKLLLRWLHNKLYESNSKPKSFFGLTYWSNTKGYWNTGHYGICSTNCCCCCVVALSLIWVKYWVKSVVSKKDSELWVEMPYLLYRCWWTWPARHVAFGMSGDWTGGTQVADIPVCIALSGRVGRAGGLMVSGLSNMTHRRNTLT